MSILKNFEEIKKAPQKREIKIHPKQVEAEVNQINEPRTITFITIDENGGRIEEKG